MCAFLNKGLCNDEAETQLNDMSLCNITANFSSLNQCFYLSNPAAHTGCT